MRGSWLTVYAAGCLLAQSALADTALSQSEGGYESHAVWIPGGRFRAAVGLSSDPKKQEKDAVLKPFQMDRLPVTNADYLSFVKENPRWQKGNAPKLFVDEQYLAHWEGSLSLGANVEGEQPVTQVSWFAARAYCKSKGGRLPTENEWEFVAAASDAKWDARQDPSWRKQILDWYAKPNPAKLPKVGQSLANLYQVFDLHGLVWEWVEDFGSTMMGGDSRDTGGSDRMLFCGAAAVGAGQKNDYASFMRYAFRSSLKARYGGRNLGFRCAKDAPLNMDGAAKIGR
jgi:formylglycine-generating enzyme required for sulfatase activity